MFRRQRINALMAITLSLIFLMICYSYEVLSFFSFTKYKGISYQVQYKSHVLYTDGCKVPKFDPFDLTVIKYYENIKGDIPCDGKIYLSIENNKVILDEDAVKKDFNGKNFSCTYRAIYRNPKNETSEADRKFGYGEETLLIFNETLPSEFVKVMCKVEQNVTYEEFLASTPLKPLVEERCIIDSAKIVMPNNLNIIMIGIDSISKLNFERHFKLTAEYLRRNLSTFEFHGHMKVGDNTFPNLTPMLTGHFVDHYYTRQNRWRYFDDLDFIWKNFSSIGYRTFFAEDAPYMGTYQLAKNGFQYPPTDYFFRPFAIAVEASSWKKASKVDCFQAKPEILVLYDYFRNFLTTMENRPYFAFAFCTQLTHDYLNKAGLADKPTFELLRDINDMGLLNRSMLVFLSDHGIRFGGIRKTFIGKIEERMPFMFISLPNWFLEAHNEIKLNLEDNQRRMTTPFDLHETFVDMYQMTSRDYSYVHTPYGISLFRNISPNRNCPSAYIQPHWCVCHDYKELSISSKIAVEAANALVTTLNNITIHHREFCAELKLDAILDALISKPERDLLRYKELRNGDFENYIVFGDNADSHEKLMITVRTIPGKAEFESTIEIANENYKVLDISRTNMYGTQGDCVDDSSLRKYCFCV